MLHSTALLIAIATGSAAGVIAAGLVPVDRDRRIPLFLLIPLIALFAAGVSIAATVIFMFWSLLPLAAGVIALLLGVDIMRHRKDHARDDVAIPESVTGS
jgi:fatty acid desaturase